MASKKAAKKTDQSKKTKATGGNSSILSFLLIPVVIILIAIGAAGYFVINLQLAPINAQHQQALVETVAHQYEAYVNNVLKQQNALISKIASSPAIAAQITARDSAKLLETETLIAEQIPYALSVHIFQVRGAQARPNAQPPLSHSGLDMIRRAEQGQNLSVEVHQHDGQAYLNSVKAIRTPSGRLIGTLTVTQALDYLKDELAGIDASKGSLLIQQRFEGAPVQTLVTYGAKNNNSVMTMKSSNPNWQLTFQPADSLADSTLISVSHLWIAFGVLAIVAAGAILLGVQRLQASLRQDANTFAKEYQAMLSGQKSSQPQFTFAIFSTLTKTINRLRMGKLGNVKMTTGSGTKSPDLLPGLAPAAAAKEELDVTMMDDDNDLLGISQPAKAQPSIAIDEALFRAYDIRGIYGQNLTTEVAYQIGMAIGSEAIERGEQAVIVGRDGRLSGPEVSQAVIRGLTASGRDVVDIGIVPTPVCYFACEYLKVSACVMVTGSHNPRDYNGFKIVLGGNTLMDDEIKGLYHRIENQHLSTGQGNVRTQDVTNAYLSRISQDIKTQRPLKVVIDCGNGVAGNLAPQLIKGIGSHVLPLFCDVDGNFPNHHPDPSDQKNMQDLARTVVETRADLGLAFDGDGDRLGLITNSGQIIYADRILMLLAKQVLQSNPGATVLYDVKSSRRLKNLIVGFGGKSNHVENWPFIYETQDERNWSSTRR